MQLQTEKKTEEATNLTIGLFYDAKAWYTQMHMHTYQS